MTTYEAFRTRAEASRIVPVLTIEHVDDAVPLAKALVDGGLDILEVTLRTDAALDAIKEIAAADIDCLIGAGTVLSPSDADAAISAGSEFLVTPGTTPELVAHLKTLDHVALPGISTASEAMALYAEGFDLLKFFPAGPAGGPGFLKSLAGPLANITFMPTGGVNPDNLASYLNLPNTLAAGGSWMVPTDVIQAKDWSRIYDLTASAVKIAKAL